MKNNKKAVFYIRIGHDDKKQERLIQEKKRKFNEFIKKNNIKNYDFYIDIGYSGTNFNRPEFQRMLRDIENNKIDCVIYDKYTQICTNIYKYHKFIYDYLEQRKIKYISWDNLDKDSQMINKLIYMKQKQILKENNKKKDFIK